MDGCGYPVLPILPNLTLLPDLTYITLSNGCRQTRWQSLPKFRVVQVNIMTNMFMKHSVPCKYVISFKGLLAVPKILFYQ